jgi:hypothetical protein
VTKYIAKPNEWFNKGTECILVVDCGDAGGIFSGIRTSEGPPGEFHPKGEQYKDEELCNWDEFIIVEED